MTTLYEILGVMKDATGEQIKKAYRKKAFANHPDRGGDEEKFKATALAYRILSDEEKRKRYDAGENPESLGAASTEEQEALSVLATLYLQCIEYHGDNIEYEDAVASIGKQVDKGIKAGQEQKKALTKKTERLEKAKKRMRVRSGENMLANVLEAEIRKVQGEIAETEKQIHLGERVKEMLSNYVYDVETRPVQTKNHLDAFVTFQQNSMAAMLEDIMRSYRGR